MRTSETSRPKAKQVQIIVHPTYVAAIYATPAVHPADQAAHCPACVADDNPDD